MENDFWSNMTPVEKREFAPIERGTYVAVIENAVYDATTQPNKVEFTLKITGTCDGENCSIAGRKVWKSYQMSEQGKGFFAKDLGTLGIDHKTLPDVDAVAKGIASLINGTVEIFVQPKVSTKNPSKTFDTVYFNNLIERAPNSELGF